MIESLLIFAMRLFSCTFAACQLSDTSVLDIIMCLEIHCHFNAVTLFSPYCIEEINTPSVAIRAHRLTKLDQPNLTRKIQHVQQLWDSYWFLVHRLIDFAFLRLQIDGDSRGFLMRLKPDVCLAVSKGFSVLCVLITHNCLRLQHFVDLCGGKRKNEEDFSKKEEKVHHKFILF